MRHLVRVVPLVLLAIGFAPTAPARARDEADIARVAALLGQLRDQLEYPGLTVVDAARNLQTPERALAFVRDEVEFMPYRGALHGAEGALRVRVANSLDKAVLLKALLDEMGVESRLVGTAWPVDARPHPAAGRSTKPPALAELRALLAARQREPAAVDRSPALRAEIVEAAATIRRMLAAADEFARYEGTPTEDEPTQDPVWWAWVRVGTSGSAARDLDPTLPGRAARPAGEPLAGAPVTATVRMLADETELVGWAGPASALLGFDAQILLLPHDLEPQAATDPASVAKWVPVLRVGASNLMGRPFVPGGETIAPTPPSRSLFGTTPGTPGQVGGKSLRLEIAFEGLAGRTRTVRRLEEGFDPHRLVALFRIGTGVSHVPAHITAARLIDEALDVYDLRRRAAGAEVPSGHRADRSLSSRSARVLNTLFRLQPALASAGLRLAWQGPAVFVETISLEAEGETVYSVTRLDVWRNAFGPAAGSTRAQRIEWGLATLAVEGHLLDADSVNAQLLASPDALRVVRANDDSVSRLTGDEIAGRVLADDGLVLTGFAGRAWSIRPNGDLLGSIASHGTAAKGGESRSEAAGRGYAAIGSAAMSALGAPSGMLVSGIASYLNELAEAYLDAARVLDALADTIETGDARHVLDALGKYDSDLDRRLVRALASGALRGWAESALHAGIRPGLPSSGNPFGPSVGDRILDGGLAGGLSWPEDLPILSEAIEGALDVLLDR